MIRKANIDDLDSIYKIEVESFPVPWEKVSMEVEFYKDYSYIFVYEENNRVVAYIIAWFLEVEAEIMSVAVTKEYRGKGIGQTLVEHVFNLFGSGVNWFLEVATDNNEAISLYKKYGFKISNTIKNYYGIGLDAYRMINLADESKIHKFT